MSEIRSRVVLRSVLLQTLMQHPNGVIPHEAYDEIERFFLFPEDWYRQIPHERGHEKLREMGISNWRTVSQERLVQIVKTEPQWQNEIRWARNDLRIEGLLDANAPRGVWRLTTDGSTSAASSLDDLNESEKEIATPISVPRGKGHHDCTGYSKTTCRDELLKMLSLLAESMPISDLELLVDIARVIRLRSLDTDS